jgi:hypothetical protein
MPLSQAGQHGEALTIGRLSRAPRRAPVMTSASAIRNGSGGSMARRPAVNAHKDAALAHPAADLRGLERRREGDADRKSQAFDSFDLRASLAQGRQPSIR